MKPINLNFDKETSDAFNTYYTTRYINYTRRALLCITTLFSLSGFFDYFLAAQGLASVFTLRFAIVLPLLITINLIVFHPFFANTTQYFILLYMVIICAFLFYLSIQMEGYMSAFYICGLIVTKLMTVSILRLRFVFALSASFIIFLCSQYMMFLMSVSFSHFLLFNYFAGSITTLGLGSNFFLEQSAKIEYLHRNMIQREIETLENQNRDLNKMARRDPLTGLVNRKTFDEQWALEWRRAHRAQQPLSLILADIDYFKEYKDCYTDQAGDICLKLIGQILRKFGQRPGDLVARYDGEKCIFLLPDTRLKEASSITEKILKAVLAAEIPHNSSPLQDTLSLSLGVVCVDFSTMHIDLEEILSTELIRLADSNLQAAKDQGHNRQVASYL